MGDYDDYQESDTRDLDIAELSEMNVVEAPDGGPRPRDGGRNRRQGRARRPPILARQSELAGHAYATGILDIVDEGFWLHAPPRPDAEPGRCLRLVQPASAASGCESATASAVPFAPRARARQYWGHDPGRSRQRHRSRNGTPSAGVRRPHPGPPGCSYQPRDGLQESQPATGQPGQPDRQGPARTHRSSPAQGRQDDAPQAHRQRHQAPTTPRSC